MLIQVWKCTSEDCGCGQLFEEKSEYIGHLKSVARVLISDKLAKKLTKSLKLRSTFAAKKAKTNNTGWKALFNFLSDNRDDIYRLACYEAEILYNRDSMKRNDIPLLISTSLTYCEYKKRFELYASMQDMGRRLYVHDRSGSDRNKYYIVENYINSRTKDSSIYFYEYDGYNTRRSSKIHNKSPDLTNALRRIMCLENFEEFTLRDSPWEFLNDEFSSWASEAEQKFEEDCEMQENIAKLKDEAYSLPYYRPSDWVDADSISIDNHDEYSRRVDNALYGIASV